MSLWLYEYFYSRLYLLCMYVTYRGEEEFPTIFSILSWAQTFSSETPENSMLSTEFSLVLEYLKPKSYLQIQTIVLR
jgi:hypothetical protein